MTYLTIFILVFATLLAVDGRAATASRATHGHAHARAFAFSKTTARQDSAGGGMRRWAGPDSAILLRDDRPRWLRPSDSSPDRVSA